jgi:demethylmenaquinone methyltransferase/2-methoxy-6-polyprenyl-1,4-benzoquinol methylase
MNVAFKPRRFFLRDWPTGLRERQAYVDPIFATIATKYDFMTRALSLGQEQHWKKKAVSLIAKNGDRRSILDLATGTGDFPLRLLEAGLDAQILGLDRNPKMLEIAVQKCRQAAAVKFIMGDLMQIPFRDNSFDGITMGYGLRYVADIRQTIKEVFRLLRRGGIFVCLDFGLPKNPFYRQVCFGYLLFLGSLWGLILHKNASAYWHIVESLRAYPGQATIGRWLEEAGFAKVELHEQLGGIITILSAIRL